MNFKNGIVSEKTLIFITFLGEGVQHPKVTMIDAFF